MRTLLSVPPCTALVRLDQKISFYDNNGARQIIIPRRYRRQPVLGTVVLVGEPYRDDDGIWDIGVYVGARVYLGPFNGKLVDLDDDDNEYRLCQGYNHDPHILQANVPHPQTAWPDIYLIIENDDGTPYTGTPTRQELRAWMNQIPDNLESSVLATGT